MLEIDSSKVKGEAGTGYEAPDGKGAFECANCRYFSAGTCGQSTMTRVSNLPRAKNGRIEVDPHGCCEYVDRKGSVREDAFRAAAEARGAGGGAR